MNIISLLSLLTFVLGSPQKLDLDTLNNYSEFLNSGNSEKLRKLKSDRLENDIFKSKADALGEVFAKSVSTLRASPRLDVVFLIDASSSVGEGNFASELKFVRKLLGDVTVDHEHARVAVVSFGSPGSVVRNIDEISNSTREHNKCHLLNNELNKIAYNGGETYTLGAFEEAKDIFKASNRNDSKKVLFLITDGYSNGGDPTPVAEDLKADQVTIFTIGIRNGNYKELYDISSSPGEFYSYLLDSFEEFEDLARRALHVDLKSGDYIPLGFDAPCDGLCDGGDCCDTNAVCSCGTTTGHYSCVCPLGYYGTGLKNSCQPCTPGTYAEGPNMCLPCPDPLHTTATPAVGIESCKCKSGYRATKNYGCKEVKCNKLSVPEHGYFVKKKECQNVVNSACGTRCEVGYTLVGTSIRLCQPNATWSGIEPVCEVKTCSRPPVPKDGWMRCSHPDLGIEYNETDVDMPVDTVCSFKCGAGKVLTGSRHRTCIPLAIWDGLRTICKPIKCSKLPPVRFGKLEPSTCGYGKQEFGKKCKVVCDPGFEIHGPAQRHCGGKRGSWDNKPEVTTCHDVTPPQIICPNDITTRTSTGKKFAQVSWILPNITDDSNLNVTTWTKPSIRNVTDFKFAIGNNTVTYFAQDVFHNRAKCSFNVTVIDGEVPVIEGCVDPPPFLTGDEIGANVTWDEPSVHDNSQNVEVARSRGFGFFSIGTFTVTYNATDSSGNKNSCALNITVESARCEPLQDPSFGNKDCINQTNGVHCLITCQEGYAIPITELDEYDNGTSFICQHADPIWYNQEGLNHPDCSVTEVPEEILQNGEIKFEDPNVCNDTSKVEEIENDIKTLLNDELCSGNCTIDTKSECQLEQEEEKLNSVGKREVDFESVPHRNRQKKKKKFNVKFQVRGKIVNETAIGSSTTTTLRHGHNVTVKYEKARVLCPEGFAPRKHRCVQCPKGTFHNATRNKCQSCPFGQYNDLLGRTQCVSCPPNFSTRKIHSKKPEQCIEQCPPGTFARKKLVRVSKKEPNKFVERTTLKPYCRSCGLGHFQPFYGRTRCSSCPPGYATLTVGAKGADECVPTAQEKCKTGNLCGNGTCSVDNEYQYSCECYENYVGPKCDRRISDCDSNPCSNGGTCVVQSIGTVTCYCPVGFQGRFCQEPVVECDRKCLNNGTCVHTGEEETVCACPTGFHGDSCEVRTDYCEKSFCENDSTCEEGEGTYRCRCKNGFIGKRCNLLPCDYRPCSSGEICENIPAGNATKESYRCSCPEGYTGELCDELIDHCSGSPCANGGSCVNNPTSYSCLCSKLHYGPSCEYTRNTRYVLNFQRYDTNDYIKLAGFAGNLTEASVCLWMQTKDDFNYGTILSYATRSKDNAFTLTDYTGLVFYVNNNYVVTDVLLNDGYWHHVCTTWRSLNGTYQVFVDGKLWRSGRELSPDTYIEGFGNMVIGQEQDAMGGRFSQVESFVGKMAYVDIWSEALTQEMVLRHFNDCNESLYGDLYAWPEMQDYLTGGIQVLNSTFCLKCAEPRPLYNGFIDTADNVAYYSCYKGFVLSEAKYSAGRKCTKASRWEGTYEPYCKRVYCGYPGSVRNGYPIGNRYFYNEHVVFHCYESYELTGNDTITCMENGRWYPEKPQCIGIQCSAFKPPSDGNITIMSDQSYEDYIEYVTRFEPGTQIEVTCNDNFNLTGESVITCQENGTWDYEPPACVSTNRNRLSCDLDRVPNAPDNGYVDLDSLYNAGNGTTDFVEYKCRTGYKLRGDNVTTCIIDGYWTQADVTCEVIVCGQTPLGKNMLVDEETLQDGYHFGNMIKYKCVDGYNMFGNNIIRCQANGRWSRLQGKCIKKSCKKPNVKPSTDIRGKSYLYGDKVTVTCGNGSTYELLCDKEGVWVGEKDESC